MNDTTEDRKKKRKRTKVQEKETVLYMWYMGDTLDTMFTNVMYAESEAFNHSALCYLTIQSSNWFFDLNHTANMHADLFLGSNLSFVVLSYNNFRDVDQARLERILTPLQTAEYLYMSEIGLSEIPPIIQKNFTTLKVLGFMSNILTGLSPDTFNYMVNLRKVELQDNHLTIINVKAIKSLLKRKVTIDMQDNPFSCSCDLRLFLDEFQMYRGNPRGQCNWRGDPAEACFEGTEYLCQSPESLKTLHLDDVIITEQQCLLTFQQTVVIHALSGIFIIVFLLMIVLYRPVFLLSSAAKYRWQWRYWVYMMNVRWSRHYDGPYNRRARYNTFVSYCKADSNFILTSVLPQVERGRRLPLCIHERDFEPGKYFTQNVVERMEESRQVLIVLSNAFLRNDWCRFELFVAHRYGLIHRRLPVTVVQLETLHMEYMDAHVITLAAGHTLPGVAGAG
ncbi:hypothetical protein C0Q70_15206 [Pomacea canaliculata]|uniref:TIR domain-containing protein n=1 Tax=Pomacea canaliculata TaxID=400727 RepID=A0A2T7NU83_POMCA|nr:hypothetical protein C0Q70_15206 [Pomacea canaliculata]